MVRLKCSAFKKCAADFLNERLVTVLSERDQWKRLARQFAEVCELDGFGHVRHADHGTLTQLCNEFKELNNDTAQK